VGTAHSINLGIFSCDELLHHKAMIEIRWSDETNEIDLGGTLEDLQYVRQSILHLLQIDKVQSVIPAAIDFDPAPYSGKFIQKSEGSTI
jgi:hypothetical protein